MITILIVLNKLSECLFFINEEETIMNIGTWIIQYRKKNDLSQGEFGKLVGVNKQTVSRWEKGTLQPSIYMCYLIADIMGVTIIDLMDDKSEESEFLPVFRKNEKFDVGLNSVFKAIKDYDTLLVFLDMAIEIYRLQNDEFPIAYMLVLSDLIVDPKTKENGMPIIDIEFWGDQLVMCLPDDYYDSDLIIRKSVVKAVKPRVADNNSYYIFDIITNAEADGKEGKVQVLLDLEHKTPQ